MLDEKKKKAILHRVDHTLLNPNAVTAQLNKVCAEALLYETATVCIMPAAVAYVKEKFPHLTVCTVVGFPFGYQTTAVKRFETADALQNGATEIDLVINRMDVKNGDFTAVTAEIAAIKEICGDKILKVIVEVCDLTTEEKISLCQCVTAAKADYIKTSTGFGKGGATLEDVALFRKHIGKDVKIKAAGGLRTAAELEAFYDAGVERIGASCGVEVLK
jgi:deoxyribose-phosphate aldolase